MLIEINNEIRFISHSCLYNILFKLYIYVFKLFDIKINYQYKKLNNLKFQLFINSTRRKHV